jgi:hypothetical protein
MLQNNNSPCWLPLPLSDDLRKPFFEQRFDGLIVVFLAWILDILPTEVYNIVIVDSW